MCVSCTIGSKIEKRGGKKRGGEGREEEGRKGEGRGQERKNASGTRMHLPNIGDFFVHIY